ncbi:OsmC family protein [Gimesia sp.]|uniref:OsmC family protein n=1 Tax=Gimesia sp. TaxID=2024833 RepID=UPI003A90D6EA
MSKSPHSYRVTTVWDGSAAGPAKSYKDYSRDHVIKMQGKPDLLGSSDPGFRGDASRHNPEDLLVASLSACHMLWYLHLCTVNGISVFSYTDQATGLMAETADGGGHFTSVTLAPKVHISPAAKANLAKALHQQAHAKCFIANSVNFPVTHQPEITTED